MNEQSNRNLDDQLPRWAGAYEGERKAATLRVWMWVCDRSFATKWSNLRRNINAVNSEADRESFAKFYIKEKQNV